MTRSLLLGLGCLLFVGCGRGPLVPVQGKVSYKGYTLQSGVIVFSPDTTRGMRGQIAVGKIRDDGTFSLYTGDNPGVSAGWYRVTVASLAPPGYAAPSAGRFDFPQSIVPEKYHDPDMSMIACEVKGNRQNTIDVSLE